MITKGSERIWRKKENSFLFCVFLLLLFLLLSYPYLSLSSIYNLIRALFVKIFASMTSIVVSFLYLDDEIKYVERNNSKKKRKKWESQGIYFCLTSHITFTYHRLYICSTQHTKCTPHINSRTYYICVCASTPESNLLRKISNEICMHPGTFGLLDEVMMSKIYCELDKDSTFFFLLIVLFSVYLQLFTGSNIFAIFVLFVSKLTEKNIQQKSVANNSGNVYLRKTRSTKKRNQRTTENENNKKEMTKRWKCRQGAKRKVATKWRNKLEFSESLKFDINFIFICRKNVLGYISRKNKNEKKGKRKREENQ